MAKMRSKEGGHECYEVHTSSDFADIPLINLDGMCNPTQRPMIVEQIANACLRNGFFQVINHGISQQILDGALSMASDFFNLPTRDKTRFLSPDIHKPVRYCTSFKDVYAAGQAQSWRAFLKHYAHPIQDWIALWPQNPPTYRERIGEYAVEIQKLSLKLMAAITESLGLGPTYLVLRLEEGMQVMSINCYPPCPKPLLSLGIAQHSDYSCLTILLQDSPGLQILDPGDGSWRAVPVIPAALQVHVGDHLEVLSNGRYKSVVHRVTLRDDGTTRISIASLHSLGMDMKMEVARELVDDKENKEGYRGSSFRDFLNFASKNELGEDTSYLDSLKINP